MLYRIKMRLAIGLLSLSLSNFCLAQAVETQLSSERVTLGDVVNVTYIVKDATSGTPDFSALQKDFAILYTDYGNAVNIVNGVASTQSFYRLQLQPKKAGQINLPAIQFGSLQSTPRKLVVSAYANNAWANFPKQNGAVFVRGEVSGTSPYVQSQVLYKFKLFFRTQLRDPRIELPHLKTVTFLPVGDGQNYQTRINGALYNVVEKTFALFPKKAGSLVIPPISFRALALSESTNPFTLFSFVEPKSIALNTQGFNLVVRDIPANYQGTSWLPAQNISLTEEWSNTQHIEAGMPVTRTVHIKAQGLSADQLPDLNFEKINGVSIYAERPKRNTIMRNDRVIGDYSQKITYIPNDAQSFSVPNLKLNWWNTHTNTNQIAELPAITVQVQTAPDITKPVLPSLVSAPIPLLNAAPKAFYTSFWFWMACSLFSLWIITLWMMLRRRNYSQPSKPTAALPTFVMSDFAKACRSNCAVEAKEQLLQWAKTAWPDKNVSLTTLQELIPQEAFCLALQELEQALYAKKPTPWHGESLLAAFVKVKTSRPATKKTSSPELLPPLNPQQSG